MFGCYDLCIWRVKILGNAMLGILFFIDVSRHDFVCVGVRARVHYVFGYVPGAGWCVHVGVRVAGLGSWPM